jgi:alkanesulfonate monooxygenase SsuD/methylene tetrahydromethanopterin reductase-like flavin-dependent oxidoreductase (luciferase family)
VAAVRACWEAYRRGHGRYEGRFYRIRLPVFQPGGDGDRGDPPVYMAGVNPRMVAIAGECADGLAAHPFTTPEYLGEVVRPALTRGAENAGRPVPKLLLQVVVAPDREAAVRQMTAYTVPAYRRVLDHAGLGDVADKVATAGREGRRSDARRLVDENVLDRLAVVIGDDLEAGLSSWLPLCDQLSLSVPWYGMSAPDQLVAARRLLEQLAQTRSLIP